MRKGEGVLSETLNIDWLRGPQKPLAVLSVPVDVSSTSAKLTSCSLACYKFLTQV